MRPQTNYSADLGDRDPLAAIAASRQRMRELIAPWPADRFDIPYARGKWTGRQVLTHLAQTELALGTRARMALSTPSYVAQPFDQDAWVARERRLSGQEALEAFLAVSRMNAVLFEGLSPAELAVAMSHPEYGTITVDWILHLLAGHQIHHLRQLESIPTR